MTKQTFSLEELEQIDLLVSGVIGWRKLPESWSGEQKAGVRLTAVGKMTANDKLQNSIRGGETILLAEKHNCEQMIGELRVPLAIAGPMRLYSEKVEKIIQVPLATTEGALVASVQRGMKATFSAGIQTQVIEVGTSRAPVLVVEGMEQGKTIIEWLLKNISLLETIALETSSHLKLLGIEPELVGRNLYVRLRFETGEAMGMNMVTIATDRMMAFVTKQFGIRCAAVSGNACVDKKPAWRNFLSGRGLKVQAEVRLSRATVRDILKATPEQIVEVVTRKSWLGSMVSGAMGFNAHFANMVAALYLATGQDIAHVVEGSMGITTAEVVEDNLYFNVWLPSVMVGVVGGGTQLPTQRASLSILGLSSATEGDKKKLAAIVAGTVLCGELSLSAALATQDLAGAHQQLSRGRA